MPLAPIQLPPGVVKPATPLQAKGRFWDANLIRWQAGKLQPVGGWSRISSTPLLSTARAMMSWTDNVNAPYCAVGCEEHLYILDGSNYRNITPATFLGAGNGIYGAFGAGDYGELLYGLDVAAYDITSAVRSSNVVTITTAEAHQYIVGLQITVENVTNSSFNGNFTVASVPTSTTFTYAQTAANASSSGGVCLLVAADRRPISQFYVPSFTWTFDNWGEDLLAVASSDGRLLHWSHGETVANEAGDAVILTASRVSNIVTVTTTFHHGYTTGNEVVIVGNSESTFNGTWTIASVPSDTTFTFADSGTNATGTGGTISEEGIPTNNRGVVVTQERHAVLFGCGGNSRRVAWSSREDYTDWDFADPTNTAGYLDLETSSRIVMATAVREGTLIWTEDEAWLMRFIGLPYIYGIERIGYGCGLMAPRSFATFAGRCIWIGREGWWIYDGGYVKPLPCEVGAYVFDNLDPNASRLYTHGSDNGLFNEVWFWYPTIGSIAPDRYVIYNYAEGWWSIGEMTRTAAEGAGVFPFPITADAENNVYYQEDGWDAAGTSLVGERYAESGSLNLQQGNGLTFIRQALTDSGYGYSSTALTFYTSFTPEGAETTVGPFNPRSNGYTDTRATGREFRVKIEATQDAPWSIGEMRLDLTPQGSRR